VLRDVRAALGGVRITVEARNRAEALAAAAGGAPKRRSG
jgi:hypothetical protein